MLLPKVRYPDAPLYTKGCAHEDDKKTPVSEDLCHVRSANPNKRTLCAGCKSPYKARVMYRPDTDRPDAPIGAPGELERLMAAHYLQNPPPRLTDIDEDDSVEGEAPAEPKQGVKGPHKRKAVRGEELLQMAATLARLSKGTMTVKGICEGVSIDQGRYYDLLYVSTCEAEFKALIVQYSLSLASAVLVGKFPVATHAQICKMLDTRQLSISKLTRLLRRSRVKGVDLRQQCINLGIRWPDTPDAHAGEK